MFLFENSLEFKWEVINKIWESDILKGSLAMTQSLRKEKKTRDDLKHDDLKDSSNFLKVHLYILPILAYTKKNSTS